MSIQINIKTQSLFLHDAADHCIATYPISSAKKGVGEITGSEQTPRGLHTIHQKIGENMPIFTVFRGRLPTGELWDTALSSQDPDRDFILTRILWLTAPQTPLERYIYIHGTNDEERIGTPHSHGCIRMRNQDVIDLFDRVCVGDVVMIKEDV